MDAHSPLQNKTSNNSNNNNNPNNNNKQQQQTTTANNNKQQQPAQTWLQMYSVSRCAPTSQVVVTPTFRVPR